MEIDQNLYSRQIGTFGMEAMGKLVKLDILIFGMRGLGVETAKNIILAGPHRVAILDPVIVSLNDLGSNFYLSESNIGKSRRDEASITQLKELNPYVHVDVLQNANILEHVKNFHVVVITEFLEKSLVEEINSICHANKIGFIYTASLGLSGFAFVDFGDEHIIRDENGEECKQYLIRFIDKVPKGIVTIDENVGTGKIALSDGDHVVFREVEGMTELNNSVPRKIEYISPISIGIGDISSFGEYTNGGIMEQVKVPKTYSYKSLTERFENPYNNNKVPDPIDLSKFGRNELLHVGILALNNFYKAHNCLPELNNENHSNEVVESAKRLYESYKEANANWIQNAAEFDPKVIANIARFARSQIVPVSSFLGGVVAQEIVKFTGKYTPLDQWLWFDFYEILENLGNPDRTPLNSRYDDQVAIFGKELQEKLFNSNVFMIGAGALGCEFIKEFALMGISTGKDAVTTVTDNDNIEISNLNRQFLFRREDVSESKSKTACRVVKKMNPDYKTVDLQALVSPDNEHVFNDKFWEKQTIIINAVDNVKARKYIDSKAVWYGKALIDSGTLGTKAHVQLVVPHVTSCYNDTQDPVEESIPMCLLHNFPSMIEHCIQWARDNFNGYFTDVISDCEKFLKNKTKFYNDLKKEGNITVQLDKLSQVKRLIDIAATKSFEKCIEFAVERYTENYDHKIRQLLHNFPENYINPDGSKFWSGAKRVPHPLPYSPLCDETGLGFVASYAIILARGLGIKETTDINYIKEYSAKVPIPHFEIKNVKIKIDNNAEEEVNNIGKDEETQLTKLTEELSLYDNKNITIEQFRPHEFEKDNDANFHIDFVNCASNLRARNYRINECDRLKTKMIAGKIIPAIATTTAAITGLVALQIYVILSTNKIEAMRNTFMNLAMGLFVLTEPAEKICMKDKDYDQILLSAIKAIPPNWTVWDKIEINRSMTIKEFIDYLAETYQIEISIITCNNVSLIQTYQASHKQRFGMKIEDCYNTYSAKKLTDDVNYLVVEISADTSDGAAAIMPLIKYKFR